MNLFGSDEPDPGIIVSRDDRGWWNATGRKARTSDSAADLRSLLEILGYGNRSRDTVVEVRQRGGSYRTTIEQLQRDNSRHYPGPSRPPRNDEQYTEFF